MLLEERSAEPGGCFTLMGGLLRTNSVRGRCMYSLGAGARIGMDPGQTEGGGPRHNIKILS